jgi:hypothetical protein
MPRVKDLAFRCEDPRAIAEFLVDAFDLELLEDASSEDRAVVTDGDTNITLEPASAESRWRFGLEMTPAEMQATGLHQASATVGEGVGTRTLFSPEGHRVDVRAASPGESPGEEAPVDAARAEHTAKVRHIAFCCKDTYQVADFLNETFGLEVLYRSGPSVVVMSDGNINFTILPETFMEQDPVPWHFGFAMPADELAERSATFAEMGVLVNDGVKDGRPVEEFIHTPEGHRIDISTYWPTQKGQSRRQTGPSLAEDPTVVR